VNIVVSYQRPGQRVNTFCRGTMLHISTPG
jgi:hypothetical protein